MAIGPPLDPSTGLHPALTTVPLHGVDPSQIVLATRAGDRNRLVTAFRKIAEATLTGPTRPHDRPTAPADSAA